MLSYRKESTLTTKRKTTRKKKSAATTEVAAPTVEEVVEPTQAAAAPQAVQNNPREVLLQVFEQGARASNNWDQSQARIQCIYALQQTENLADIPEELKSEINSVLGNLLQAGQLHFGLQQLLYPMIKELE